MDVDTECKDKIIELKENRHIDDQKKQNESLSMNKKRQMDVDAECKIQGKRKSVVVKKKVKTSKVKWTDSMEIMLREEFCNVLAECIGGDEIRRPKHKEIKKVVSDLKGERWQEFTALQLRDKLWNLIK